MLRKLATNKKLLVIVPVVLALVAMLAGTWPLGQTSTAYAAPDTESLWSESNSVSAGLTLSNSGYADGLTTENWANANGDWAVNGESWVFVMGDSSVGAGDINSVTLYLKHFQSGTDDNFLIEISYDDGLNWSEVHSYTQSSVPPTANATEYWDVTAVLGTWTKINAAQVRIKGNGKNKKEDTVNWFVDTVELRVAYTPAIETYTITATAGSDGTISPSGEITVEHGANQTFNITPDEGYHVADITVDGGSVGAVTEYTFINVTTNYAIHASFAINTYTITATAGSGGTIFPSGAVPVEHGADKTFNITPDEGYHVADVTVDGGSVGAVTEYTFTNVTADHTIEASFADTYTITATYGSGGIISPSGEITVEHGADKTFTITPDEGYHVADVTVDEGSVGAVTEYTFTNVTADHTIEASFAIETYTITATAGSGGTIYPSGEITVEHGADQTFTITPDEGYHVSGVVVDGTPVELVDTYTFTNVTADHTIHASFAIDTYTITATAGEGGTISPGTITVDYGADQTFTITPNEGYHVADVTVDGGSVGAVTEHTFTSVTADHTIEASFAIDTHDLKIYVSGSGTTNPPADNDYAYPVGTVASITATPEPGWHFVNWTGDVSTVAEPNWANTTITMDGDKTITANFAETTVTNSTGASDVTANSARLNGEVTSTGGEDPTVHIYWGATDGGTTAASWDNDVNLGVKGVEIFFTDISGLTPGTTYYYRCYAVNSAGSDWADATSQFITIGAPTIQFTSTASSRDESVTPANLELTLSAVSGQDVSVDYAVTGGTADGGGVDYTLAAGTANITAGSLTTNISVAIVDDTLDEPDETIIVTISTPVNAELGANTQHTYTINDNDAASGGGGGGIKPSPPEPLVTAAGVFTQLVTLYSEDTMVQLSFDEDTLGLTEAGEPLSDVYIVEMEDPLPPPADAEIIGLVYDLGPDGATFDPPITLTFTYDESLIPEGVAEEDLVIAIYDEASGQWVELEGSVVNPETNTITAPVSHFTSFTTLAYSRPAAFTASELSITPTEVDIGETVDITILVTNTGGQSGSYEVILKINGLVEATKTVTLAAGDIELVSFSTIKNTAGTYLLEVDGLMGSFAVKEKPVAPPTVTPPTVTPPIVTPPTVAPPTTPTPSNLPIIGGIIAALVAMVGLIYFLLSRRYKYAASTLTGSLTVVKERLVALPLPKRISYPPVIGRVTATAVAAMVGRVRFLVSKWKSKNRTNAQN